MSKRTHPKAAEKYGFTSATAGADDVKCPFFVAHNKTEVVCEGFMDNCRTSQKFKLAKDKAFHQKTFCENQYERCEMYCSIMHWKWPDD